MLRYQHNDDGMYNQGYRIYETDGRFFADTDTEEHAKQIVSAVNAFRKLKEVAGL